jgi:hypothetical protein
VQIVYQGTPGRVFIRKDTDKTEQTRVSFGKVYELTLSVMGKTGAPDLQTVRHYIVVEELVAVRAAVSSPPTLGMKQRYAFCVGAQGLSEVRHDENQSIAA